MPELARGQRAPTGPAFGRQRPRVFALHREWERLLFDSRLGGGLVAGASTGAGRQACGSGLISSRRSTARRRLPRSASAQNGIFLLAPTIFEFRHARATRIAILPKMASGEEGLVPGLVGTERRQRPGRDPSAPPFAMTRRAAGACAARRRGRRAARSCRPAVRTLPPPIPDAPRHQGLTYLLVDLRADGVTVRPVERLDGGRRFSPKCSSTTRSYPTANVLGEVGPGLERGDGHDRFPSAGPDAARAGTVHGRGRSPSSSSPGASARRPTPDPLLLDRVTRGAWMDAAGLSLADVSGP